MNTALKIYYRTLLKDCDNELQKAVIKSKVSPGNEKWLEMVSLIIRGKRDILELLIKDLEFNSPDVVIPEIKMKEFWNPIEECLPVLGASYLVWQKSKTWQSSKGSVVTAWFNPLTSRFEKDHVWVEEVTHWMSLPEEPEK